MQPRTGLPLPAAYSNDKAYIDDLLTFVTQTELLQTLVGGVHILDFFVNTPDLYELIIDAEWRSWFRHLEINEFIDLCLREDVESLLLDPSTLRWHNKPRPPDSLLRYIHNVRRLTLSREFENRGPYEKMPGKVALGMNAKKVHEVDQFARYLQRLTTDVTASRSEPISKFVDFGAGQGYLGRFLASSPWNQNVIALEGKSHNVENAAKLDKFASVARKTDRITNKKLHRAEMQAQLDSNEGRKPEKPVRPRDPTQDIQPMRIPRPGPGAEPKTPIFVAFERAEQGSGSIQHVEYRLEDGDLRSVIKGIKERQDPNSDSASIEVNDQAIRESLMVVSIHSCGQLSHHALRSLVLNEDVAAVAVVGCCYNLMTERLTPPSYKMASLRPQNDPEQELEREHGDPHGFPMSDFLCNYETAEGKGLQMPITARMMAVQAPANWDSDQSNDFFTRHFFRALLQRVFLDLGLVDPPEPKGHLNGDCMIVGGRSPAGGGGSTMPVVIGKMGRKAYSDFVTYTRAAVEKIAQLDPRGQLFRDRVGALSDEDIAQYATRWGPRKKELSIIWTLMAFSAQLVEAVVVVDRYLWLTEQEEVAHCWVEPVFDYKESPRNLVVVGIKKRELRS